MNRLRSFDRALILSVGVGGGHNSAASALDSWAQNLWGKKVETRCVDVLDLTHKTFNFFYKEPYMWMVNHLPALYGSVYGRLKRHQGGKKKLFRWLEKIFFRRLLKMIDQFSPQVILSTHFLPAQLVTSRRPQIPVYTVVTDYEGHSFWVNPRVKGYFVSSPGAKFFLEKSGIGGNKIYSTGIPIRPAFAQSPPPSTLRALLDLPFDLPVGLFMASSIKWSYLARALDEILKVDKNFRLVVLLGRNEKLMEKVKKNFDMDRRILIKGYTHQMDDYMGAADFAITKAGGLTVTEALSRQLPLIVYRPIPGQEEENASFLVESGAGLHGQSPSQLQFKVRQLLEDPHLLEDLKGQARRLARPLAGRNIWLEVSRKEGGTGIRRRRTKVPLDKI